MDDKENDTVLFPILKGESVGEDGEFSGTVVIILEIEQLSRQWKSDNVAILSDDLNHYLKENPKILHELFEQCGAVLAEFGDPISEFSASAHTQEAIALIRVFDATNVLENGMHIRIIAHENEGNVYFID